MRLKILLSILPVLLLIFIVGNFSIFADPVLNSTSSDGVVSTSTESVVSKQEDPIQVLNYLRQTYPKFQFDSVSQLSEIPLLYEIIAGTNVFYYANGYLIFGEILDSSGNSITDRKRNALTVSKVKDIPLEKAVKIGQGIRENISSLLCKRGMKGDFSKQRRSLPSPLAGYG